MPASRRTEQVRDKTVGLHLLNRARISNWYSNKAAEWTCHKIQKKAMLARTGRRTQDGNIKMHYFHGTIATDLARERMRDAANWRLAQEARRGRVRTSLAERLRQRLSAIGGQSSIRPSLAADAPDCA